MFNVWSYILNPEVTDASGLISVQMASIFILVLSVINTLIRNAHTAVLMESRKLEKREVRPSVGRNSGTIFKYL